MNVIEGTTKQDVLTGTTLQDIIAGYAGNDTIDGAAGDDILSGSSGADKMFGGIGDDLIFAGSGADYISDGDGNDTVNAGDGDDYVKAGRGDDVFSGGKGFDTIDFSLAKVALVADLSKGIVTGRGTDSVQGFEHFVGSSFGDNIRGSNGVEVIQAGAGENQIRSLGGADILAGSDDRDVFEFRTVDVLNTDGSHRGVDAIYGFSYNDGLDVSEMVRGVDFEDENITDHIRLTDTDAGTLLQVRQGDGFVDVALLADFQSGGATARGWAADGLILT